MVDEKKQLDADRIGRVVTAAVVFLIPVALGIYLYFELPALTSRPNTQLIASTWSTGIGGEVPEPDLEVESVGDTTAEDEDEDVVAESGSGDEDKPPTTHATRVVPGSIDKRDYLEPDQTFAPTEPESLIIRARVLVGGVPREGVSIWAVARDPAGNSFSPDPAVADSAGFVELGPIPMVIGSDEGVRVSRITVRALGSKPHVDKTVVLRIDKPRTCPVIKISFRECLAIAAVFLSSVVLAFLRCKWGWLLRVKHMFVAAITAALCIGVLLIFMEGAKVVDTAEQETGTTAVSLGFVQIVKASYVPTQSPDEWIVALTAPEGQTPGFGAPLWVILVSVVGAILMCIAALIHGLASYVGKEDSKRDDTSAVDSDKIRNQILKLVKHQLYILFAPIGAVFVYQSMLLAGLAGERLTVGIAALAAGAGLSVLLANSHKLVSKLLGEAKPAGVEGEGARGRTAGGQQTETG